MFTYKDLEANDERTNRLRWFFLVLERLLGGAYHARSLYLVVGGIERGREVDATKAGVKWLGDYNENIAYKERRVPRWKHLVQQNGNYVLLTDGYSDEKPTVLNKRGIAAADAYLEALRAKYPADNAIQEMWTPAIRGLWKPDALRKVLRRVDSEINIHDKNNVFAVDLRD